MLNANSILAVVPARGGSKGIPLKNIVPINGMPLVQYTAGVINQLDWIDRAVLSSDHPEIIKIAAQCGLDAPFVRPEHLSGDRVADWDVLVHALEKMEELDGRRYDIVVMLQPTCPFRRPDHVSRTVRKLIDEQLDAVWTVSETDSKAHPLKQLVVEEGKLDYYDPSGGQIIARQQLKPVYHRNGAAYAITRDCLLEKKSIKGDHCGAVIIEDQLVNIDTTIDLKLCEFMLSIQSNKQ